MEGLSGFFFPQIFLLQLYLFFIYPYFQHLSPHKNFLQKGSHSRNVSNFLCSGSLSAFIYLHFMCTGNYVMIVELLLSSGSFFSETGQLYSWGFGPIGKGPNVTYSKAPTLIPPTLFGQNELTPDAKVRSIFGIKTSILQNLIFLLHLWGLVVWSSLNFITDTNFKFTSAIIFY